MTKYPCANTRCRNNNNVSMPGKYCPECQAEIVRYVNQIAQEAEEEKERLRKQWERKKKGGRDDK